MTAVRVPSWLRWPPNCCESCTGWKKEAEFAGICNQSGALENGMVTDSRYRCPAFQRKAGI